MKIYFSASTGGFYNDVLHQTYPPDAIEISEHRHRALLNGQAQGKIIVVGPTGQPVLAGPEGPTEEELANAARRRRDRLLADSDRYMLPDYPIAAAQRTAWRKYRTELRVVTEQEHFPFEVRWPPAPDAEPAV